MENGEIITTIETPQTADKSINSKSNGSTQTSEADKNKKRLKKGDVPPALNLEEAVDVAIKIYELTGGEAPYSAAPDITGNKSTSSHFFKKVTALKRFGLILDVGQKLTLTELAQSIVAPKEEPERTDALKRAFLKIDLFFKLYERFKGRPLPQDIFLLNTLGDSVPRELAQDWLDNFKKSAKKAGLLEDKGDGRIQVLEIPQAAVEMEPDNGSKTDLKDDKTSERITPLEPTRTPIALGPGRLAYIELPGDWDNKKELKKLLKLLQLSLGDDFEESVKNNV